MARLKFDGWMVFALTLVHAFTSTSTATKIHTIHWNSSNPLFRPEVESNVIEINGGNHPWEYDQVNIVCPVYKPGTTEARREQYIIYSVTKEEYQSCRITQPNPKIVALCNRPYELMYFTITFRSFTPTPGGLEFRPGQDYYFISTSSRNDLHRRVGGGCSSHNMKVVFRVAPDEHADDDEPTDNTVSEEVVRPVPKQFPWSQQRDFRRTFSYYYPSSELQEQAKKSTDYSGALLEHVLAEDVQHGHHQQQQPLNSAARSAQTLGLVVTVSVAALIKGLL